MFAYMSTIYKMLSMSSFFKSSLFFVTLFLGVLNIISCTSTKQVVYLNDLEKTDSGKLHAAQNAFENPIQKNDQLWITVGGSNPADLPALNSAIGMVTGATSSTITGVAIGYLVEADGKIQMPYIGKVQAEGITRLQLEDTLTQMFKDYTKNPVVNVRFLNYNFSVMGEVNKKGTFNMVNERTTILDAISMAGDLTDFGKRDNVLVVREVNGVRSYARVNLLSKDLFKSPYYYLKTNDVLYVEPVKSKFIARKGVPQYLAIAAVGLSLLITVINLRK